VTHQFYITPEEYDQAAKNGVDSFNLERRIRLLGWNKEDAINTPLRQLTDRTKWVDIAKKNGIKYQTFMNRVNNLGWDEERAATTPLLNNRFNGVYEPNRIIPEDIIRLAEKNGIKYHTLRNRIKKGWPPLRAATEPVWSFSKAGKLGAKTMQEKYGRFHKLIFKEA
jgi:hypothetical protein